MDPDKVFANEYFIFNKNLLKFIGLWPSQKPLEKWLLRSLLFFSILTLYMPVAIKLVEEFFQDVLNNDNIIENGAILLWITALMSKYCASLSATKELQHIYEQITRDWETITDDGERKVASRYANEGRRLTILFAAFGYGQVIPYCSLPAMVPMFLNAVGYRNQTYEKELIHDAEYFIDQQQYYIYLYLHSIASCFVILSITIGIDGTYVNCVQHAIGLFYIIDYRLKAASDIISCRVNRKFKNRDAIAHQRVVDSIKIHQKALKFSELIKTTYNATFLLLSIFIVAFISTITVQVVRNVHNPIKIHRLFSLWFGAIFDVFYVTWSGQKLIDTSEDILISIYDTNWYLFPRETQALLRIMMMRSNKRTILTAGPLHVINFEYCRNILRIAFSYFSVISAVSA